jgi:uncharacterized protein YyaL (SSP411 family)
MEHESFENEKIADIMNQNFVNIKVDREERPDVDRVYMHFVQSLTGGGGWPLSVWITPALTPVYGGTYFPPNSGYGRPGFGQILLHFAKLWHDDPKDLSDEGDRILGVLKKDGVVKSTVLNMSEKGQNVLNRGLQLLIDDFDSDLGGFGGAPKFPRPVILNFLFRMYSNYRVSNTKIAPIILNSCLFTLRQMSKGGMYDQVGGGFHRYSVDSEWHVPHFEKMMYDQAQILVSLCDAFQITQEPFFKRIATETLRYVLEEMRFEGNVFWSAEDADSLPTESSPRKTEGAFYVWTKSEVEKFIGDKKKSDPFCFMFDIKDNGNVKSTSDPHKELTGQNVLIQRFSVEDVAVQFDLQESDLEKMIHESKQSLYQIRAKRPRPHLDDKILTSWNGLMISALARSSIVLDQKYLAEAVKVATFLKENLFKNGLLMRSYREGVSPIEGFLMDYAFLIRGLVDLYEAGGSVSWLQWAEELQEIQNKIFLDPLDGGYFDTSGNDPSILIRMRETYDGAEPSGNSISIMNLQRLGGMLNRTDYIEMSQKALGAISRELEKIPQAIPEALCGLDQLINGGRLFVVMYDDENAIDPYLKVIHEKFIPNKMLVRWNKKDKTMDEFWSSRIEYLKDSKLIDGKPTVYVCKNFACELPTNDLEKLKKYFE